MDEFERIQDLKARLYANIPERLFSIEQIAVIECLIYDAVDEAVCLVKGSTLSET